MSNEIYVGTKFETVFVKRQAPTDPQIATLVKWCRKFHELGLSPIYGAGSAGNLSVRTPRGFIITRTASFFERIAEQDFVEVLSVHAERRQVYVAGNHEPSSETQMHMALYRARADVNAILHAHSDTILANAARLGLPITEREMPYGTPELGEEAVRAAGKGDFFVLRNHGFVAVGPTVEEAGQHVLDVLQRLPK